MGGGDVVHPARTEVKKSLSRVASVDGFIPWKVVVSVLRGLDASLDEESIAVLLSSCGVSRGRPVSLERFLDSLFTPNGSIREGIIDTPSTRGTPRTLPDCDVEDQRSVSCNAREDVFRRSSTTAIYDDWVQLLTAFAPEQSGSKPNRDVLLARCAQEAAQLERSLVHQLKNRGKLDDACLAVGLDATTVSRAVVMRLYLRCIVNTADSALPEMVQRVIQLIEYTKELDELRVEMREGHVPDKLTPELEHTILKIEKEACDMKLKMARTFTESLKAIQSTAENSASCDSGLEASVEITDQKLLNLIPYQITPDTMDDQLLADVKRHCGIPYDWVLLGGHWPGKRGAGKLYSPILRFGTVYVQAAHKIGGFERIKAYAEKSKHIEQLIKLSNTSATDSQTQDPAFQALGVHDLFASGERKLPILQACFDDMVKHIERKFPDVKVEPVTPPMKGVERAGDKALMKYGGDVTRLRDLVRGTLVVQTDDVGKFYDVLEALAHMPEMHTGSKRWTSFEDRYQRPMSQGYCDTQWGACIFGHECEVQVTTQAFSAAKVTGHGDYEDLRRKIESLLLASMRQLPVLTEQLLVTGASPNEIKDKNGLRPLHFAAMLGMEGIVDTLLKQKANPCAHDSLGMLPVHRAVLEGYPGITQLLVEAMEESQANLKMRTDIQKVQCRSLVRVVGDLLVNGWVVHSRVGPKEAKMLMNRRSTSGRVDLDMTLQTLHCKTGWQMLSDTSVLADVAEGKHVIVQFRVTDFDPFLIKLLRLLIPSCGYNLADYAIETGCVRMAQFAALHKHRRTSYMMDVDITSLRLSLLQPEDECTQTPLAATAPWSTHVPLMRLGPILGRLCAMCTKFKSLKFGSDFCVHSVFVGWIDGFLAGLTSPHSQVTRLDLSRCNLPPTAGRALGSLIAQCSVLVELDLAANGRFGCLEGLQGLANGLGEAGHPTVEKIVLTQCGLSSSAGEPLGVLLSKCPSLTQLDLWWNTDFGTEGGLRGLIRGLGAAGHPELTKLSLSACGLQPRSGEALGIVLKTCHRLREIELGGNDRFGTAEGVEGLARGLGQAGLRKLRRLGMSNCGLLPAAGEALGLVFGRCRVLQEVELSANDRFGATDGLQGIARGLGKDGHAALSQLSLAMCGLQPHAGTALGQLIQCCHALTDLRLGWNVSFFASSIGLDNVARGLGEKKHSTLARLDVRLCDIQPKVGKALGVVMSRFRKLTEVKMGGTKLTAGNQAFFSTAEGAEGLGSGLGEAGHPKLSTFDLRFANVQPAAKKTFVAIRKRCPELINVLY